MAAKMNLNAFVVVVTAASRYLYKNNNTKISHSVQRGGWKFFSNGKRSD